MKNTLVIKFKERILVMDKEFSKRASVVGSAEYEKLQAARRDYPDFTVKNRTIKKNPSKESYKGLTYEYMERYIRASDEEKSQTVLEEYKRLRVLAECHSIRYPRIKQWFLNMYPEVAEFGFSSGAETAKTENGSELQILENDQIDKSAA